MEIRIVFGGIVSLWCWSVVSSSDEKYDYVYPVDPSAEEDGKLDMDGLVTKYGYPLEKHTVYTADGYILSLYRIPYGRKCGPSEKSKAPVLLQHGMLSSSFDYLILGPKKSLGYLLADECFDVWLGNNRGNRESRRHVSLLPKEKEFWKFSWHEMGQYDVPAMTDYILNATGQSGIHYIGHSQGTTQFFVFGALHPKYHSKIRSMHALSPVVYMQNLESPVARILTFFLQPLKLIAQIVGMHELFPQEIYLNLIGSEVCKNKYPELQSLCCNFLFLLCGFDEPQLNKTILPAIIGHTPAGSAVKQLIHYAQGILSGEFQQFDYGAQENLKIYNSTKPPKYDVSKIKIPVALYYGKNDFLAALKDIKRLEKLLPNIIEKYFVPYSKFNHLDFIFGTDVKQLIYYRLIEVLKKY